MSLVTMSHEDSGEPLCHQDPGSPGVPGPAHPALLRAWPMGADWGDRNASASTSAPGPAVTD